MKTVFERRCSRLQEMLAQQDVGVALITDPVNIYYLTGWRTNPHERFTGLLVPRTDPPVLVVPSLDVEAAGTGRVSDVRGWRDGENPFELLAAAARPDEVARCVLAVEKAAISLETFEGVAGALKPAGIADVRPLLNSLRLKKDDGELNLLQRASDIACEAFERVYGGIRPGVTEKEVACRLDQSVKEMGGDGPAFETTVLSGPRSACSHGRPGDRAIERGELVVIDFGAAFGGYLSDITRTL
ncbi:MAG: M24 family metallopeptidase, partial [Bacillota bacterium]